MAKSIKVFCAVVCSLAVLFIGVGYAALSGNLSVTGTATFKIPEVYIISAEAMDANGTDITHSETMLGATSAFSGGSSVVYKITVVNTTNVDYGYLMTTAINDETLGAGNALVNYDVYTDAACTQTMKRGTVLAPCDSDGDGVRDYTMTFYLKVTPKETATTTATVYLNFKFITPVSDIPSSDADVGALAANQAANRFSEILNDAAKLQELKGQMEDTQAAADNDRDNTFHKWIAGIFGSDITSLDTIAYVPDTISKNASLDPSDAEVCLSLFGGENLQLNIDGVDQNVYFMIYKTNVDGIGDDEYVLYMTTDPLTRQTTTNFWGGYQNHETAPVYAIVFTPYQASENNTVYYQLGDMLTGVATICDYDGGGFTLGSLFGSSVSGSGSFNPGDWQTSQGYYGLGSGQSLKTVMTAKANADSECMKNLKTQLDKAKEVLEYRQVIDGITFTAEDRFTAESLNQLKAVYGWDEDGTSRNGLSDVYNAIMNGDSTSYTQSMVVTATRWMNDALLALESK